MTKKTYSDGEVLFASDLNSSLYHNNSFSSISPISFTPTDASTDVLIIAKGVMYEVSGDSKMAGTITLVSDLDGTLDTSTYASYATGAETHNLPFTMMFNGSLSVGTHSISISGTGGVPQQIKITVLEF